MSYLSNPLLGRSEQELSVADGGADARGFGPNVAGRTFETVNGRDNGCAYVYHEVPGPFHAHVFVVVFLREPGAVEGVRPGKAEPLEHGIAAGPDAFAKPPARTNRIRHLEHKRSLFFY